MHECHDSFKLITCPPLRLPTLLRSSFLFYLGAPSSSSWVLLPSTFNTFLFLCLVGSLSMLDSSCHSYVTMPSTSHHYFFFSFSSIVPHLLISLRDQVIIQTSIQHTEARSKVINIGTAPRSMLDKFSSIVVASLLAFVCLV
jgi:hypothetical protein